MTSTHTTSGTQPPKGGNLTLSRIISVVRADIEAYDSGTIANIVIAIHAGEYLTVAKTMMPHGKWGDWLEDNFKLKGTWLRVCMRCYAAMEKIKARSDSKQIIARLTTVEKLAGLLPGLENDYGIDDLFNKPIVRLRRMPAQIALSEGARRTYDDLEDIQKNIRMGTPYADYMKQLQRALLRAKE